MADKNFTQFDLKTTLSLNDFLVGYNENGSNEIRTKISDINSFVLDKQTLSFNESNKNLTLSNGKFASLSSIDLTIIKGETYSSDADYFIQISDYNKLLTFDNINLTNVNVIINKDLNFPVGSEIRIMRKGDGNVALSASNGVNLRSVDNSTYIKYKNSVVNLVKLEENDWLLYGDLSKLAPAFTPTPTPTPTETPTNTPTPTNTETPTPTPTPTPTETNPVGCIGNWETVNFSGTTFRNGDTIPEATNASEWEAAGIAGTPAWCYYNFDSNNGATYGKLYNWYVVGDVRGLGSAGYIVPSESDWSDLETCLGGQSIAGGKMKTTGTIEDTTGLWNAPNTSATNEIGFSVIPSGYMSDGGTSGLLNMRGSFWTTTDIIGVAMVMNFNHYLASVYHGSDTKSKGYSIRLKQNN